jgi:hypothetical protein
LVISEKEIGTVLTKLLADLGKTSWLSVAHVWREGVIAVPCFYLRLSGHPTGPLLSHPLRLYRMAVLGHPPQHAALLVFIYFAVLGLAYFVKGSTTELHPYPLGFLSFWSTRVWTQGLTHGSSAIYPETILESYPRVLHDPPMGVDT